MELIPKESSHNKNKSLKVYLQNLGMKNVNKYTYGKLIYSFRNYKDPSKYMISDGIIILKKF